MRTKNALRMADGGMPSEPITRWARATRHHDLRMADGGVVPAAPRPAGNFLTRFITNNTRPGQALQGRAAQIEAATNPQPAPQPVVAAPPPPADPNNPAGIQFADGGALRANVYRKGSPDGGRVVGPGTSTSDSVPARYSHGEYVLPTDTAQAVGYENLDALKNATHTPAAVQRKGGLRLANGGMPGVDADELHFQPTPGGDAIPGMSASEGTVPPTLTDRVTPMPSDGLRNPNVGPNGSPEAQAFKASGAAKPGVGVPQAPGAAPSAGYRAGKAVARVINSPAVQLGQKVLGAASGVRQGLRMVDDIQGGNGAGALEHGLGAAADVASTMPGVPGALGMAYNAGHFVGDKLINPHLSEDTKDAIGGTINSALRSLGVGGVDTTAMDSLTPTARTGSTAAPTAVAASRTTPLEEANAAKIAAANRANPDLAGGPAPAVAPAPMTADEAYPHSGTVSSMSPEAFAATAPSQDNALYEARLAAANRGDIGALRASYGSQGFAGEVAPQAGGSAELEATFRDQLRSTNPNVRAQAMSNLESLHNSDQTNATTRRGQDFQLRAAMAPHLIAQQQRAMMADIFRRAGGDRAKAADMADAAGLTSVAKEMRDGQKSIQDILDSQQKARAESENQLQKNLEARFRTTGKDGASVPDHAKVASYRQALNVTVPEMAKELEATGNPQAIAKARDLRERGAAALDDSDHERLQQLFDFRDRAAQARGILPGAARYTHSDNLLDFRQRGPGGVDRRSVGGNHIVTRNGTSVSLNDLRYADGPSNAVLPDIYKLESSNLTRGLRTQ